MRSRTLENRLAVATSSLLAFATVGCSIGSGSEVDRWAALPHTMGCMFLPGDQLADPPGAGLVRQVTLSHGGGNRLRLDVEFKIRVPPEPRLIAGRYGPQEAPGSITTIIEIRPKHVQGDKLIEVSSPSPKAGHGWTADISMFDESNPDILDSVSVRGRTLTLVLDLNAQEEILGTGEFQADVDIVQMVAGQPDSTGLPNVFPVRSPQCLWSTPPIEKPASPSTPAAPSANPSPPDLTGAPAAADGSARYVRTKSGKVRCVVDPGEVVCERTSVEGFPQAPASTTGAGRWNLAKVDTNGTLTWAEGNIGGADLDDDLVLEYDQVQQLNGWNIEPTSGGTRFTNTPSGHGVFVSIDNVYTY
ncbi:hypothetical protein GCM10009632_04930 [Mycolicibacterium alvei]|uniref:Uncharacterized protein n=2 Tax=Mycolicibacterium alvei TaxID=67081 RepID=A0A6N4V494_9MYCO|nr:hypothetical protein MALV_56870 [Mycolicibacterium alvei]